MLYCCLVMVSYIHYLQVHSYFIKWPSTSWVTVIDDINEPFEAIYDIFTKAKHNQALHILTHWGQVTHKCISKLGHHWLRLCLVTCSAPSHWLSQCMIVAVWSHDNQDEKNFNKKGFTFQKKYMENIICEVVVIFSQLQYVQSFYHIKV